MLVFWPPCPFLSPTCPPVPLLPTPYLTSCMPLALLVAGNITIADIHSGDVMTGSTEDIEYDVDNYDLGYDSTPAFFMFVAEDEGEYVFSTCGSQFDTMLIFNWLSFAHDDRREDHDDTGEEYVGGGFG